MAIEYITHNDGQLLICKFQSSIMDIKTCMEDEKLLMENIKNAEEVIFDLTEVESITSYFLRLCANAANRIKKNKLSIINVNPSVKTIFKISNLTERINII